ncbi:MAG: glycosyltransferase, partial [Thermoleophilia bacterium]
MLAAIFWISAALIVYTHLGYPLLLRLLVALRRSPRATAVPADDELPRVSLIVAAYDEEEVIEEKVANALATDYPRELLELIVASDGSYDATAERAHAAGADLVLELPRGGKLAAQNAAAERASSEILAFSDANSRWSSDALRRLVAPFSDAEVAYACGQVRFLDAAGDNLEGVYWRYEMAVREMESSLAGITAGNGAIYAVRAEDYLPLDPSGSHDLSFPFALAKRGKRSLYVPAARAEEKMVPTMEGEFARKRRMMVGLWDIVVGEGMLSPRRYPPLFAFEILSHRLLRYLSPLLHLVALVANAF